MNISQLYQIYELVSYLSLNKNTTTIKISHTKFQQGEASKLHNNIPICDEFPGAVGPAAIALLHKAATKFNSSIKQQNIFKQTVACWMIDHDGVLDLHKALQNLGR